MKKKGVTLIELIVVFALLGIILPLTYQIYLNEIKVSNYIYNNVNTQADGRDAINVINTDFRLAKYISNDYINEVDKNFDCLNLDTSNNINISGITYKSLYYVESLSSSEPFIYAETTPPVDSQTDVYKIYLKENSTTNKQEYGISNISIVNDDNIPFGCATLDDFEAIALNEDDNKIDIKRNLIYLSGTVSVNNSTGGAVDVNFSNDNTIILNCFSYNTDNYVYFMDDTNGNKYLAKITPFGTQTVPVTQYAVDYVKPIIKGAKNFNITHSGITYNINFSLVLSGNSDYNFNVDVSPVYLGGGD